MVVLASIAGGAVEMAAAEGLRQLSFFSGEFQQAYGGRLVPLLYYMAIFMGWALGYFWLTADVAARTEQLRRSEAQSAAVRAELQQLKVQLDPHFLFNALNTLTAEIPERPDVALEMVRGIAAYMRYCLDHKDRSACPLAAEIEAARAYLRIQELRFDEALTCSVEVDADAEDVLVPHLILQGLLENAVKHGLRPTTGAPLRIQVTARRVGGALHVLVSNPGTYAPRREPARGLGLVNIRRRLELHYPGRHQFAVGQHADRVAVRMVLEGDPCFA
jgi:LytS/YehU family sensor histidine kinase